MRHLTSLLFALIIKSTIIFAQANPYEIANSITLENTKQHVYTLSSDEMEGRGTGENGQKKAAEYIAKDFRANNLDSLGFDGYFQSFNMIKYDLGESNIRYKNNSEYQQETDSLPFWGFSYATKPITIKKNLPLYYAGFGNKRTDEDLSDKVIVLLVDKNIGETHKTIKKLSEDNNAQVFMVIFEKRGPWRPNININSINKMFPLYSLVRSSCAPKMPNDFHEVENKMNALEQSINVDKPIVIHYGYENSCYFLFNTKPKTLFKAAKKQKDDYKLITNTAFCNIQMKGARIDTVKTENVLAFIEGEEKKEEVIVVSAHYDHLGKRNDTTIFYGADDNASGTVAVMETAAAFKKAENEGFKPKRSIVFVTFTGEEIGLHGADYYVKNSPIPLENTVLNFNLDMIGRNRNDEDKYAQTAYLIAQGSKSNYLKRSTKKLNKNNTNLKVSTHPGIIEHLTWSSSSDHYRFKKQHIPIACFFTGLHPDYHTPKDTPDKINYEKLTEITKLTYKSIWELANTSKNLKVKVKQPKLQ